MSQFIFGPIVDDDGFLYTRLSDGFYYLRPDPKPGLPPYFGIATLKTTEYLALKTEVESPENIKLTTLTGAGFIQDPILKTAIVSSSSDGSFEYQYLDNTTGQSPVRGGASGQPKAVETTTGGLVYGVEFQMAVKGTMLTFKWKSPANEQKDIAAYKANTITYSPTYDGDIEQYFLVPYLSFDPTKECELFNFLAFLAYSNTPGNQKITYSTIEWCQTDKPIEPCLSTQTCGDCYGLCSEDGYECIPDPGTGKLKCRVPGPLDKPWYAQPWFWIVAVVSVLIIFFVILYFLFFKKK